jgi:glucan biosynthesis protein C
MSGTSLEPHPSRRIHSMDALRACAMVLLLPIHAATLLALNGHAGAWATALCWAIHLFRLPLFFAMSGFFLVFALPRKGLRATTRSRTGRIAIPLAVGLVTLVPLTLFVGEQVGIALTPEGAPGGRPFDFELNFLWFLWYLLIIDAIAVAVHLARPGLLRRAGDGFRSLIVHPLGGVLLLSVPSALSLWPAAAWTPTAATDTFLPEPGALAYYALFFALGATLCVHRELLDEIGRSALRWAGCALAAAVPGGLLFALHNSSAYGSSPLVHGAALLTYAIAAWTTAIAIVGLFHRYLDRPHAALRYVADSSYWIYLSHMPAMVLLVALVGATALAVGPQLAAITIGSFAFSLATYAAFVRHTPLGRVLGGRRPRRPRRAALPRRAIFGDMPVRG